MLQVEISEPQKAASFPEKLMQMLTGQYISQAIHVVAKLGIADLVKDGAKSVDELAKHTEVDAQYLYRLLRALASHDIFFEVEKYCFEITPLAKYLQSDFPGSIRYIAILEGEEWLWQSWGNLFNAVKTGTPGFDHKFGMQVIEYLQQNSQFSQTFKAALKTYSTIINDAVLDIYDFSSTSKLVDVGGGAGTLLLDILKANPAITGVLFDLPPVIERAKEGNHFPAELIGRYEMVGGDFFASVPEDGSVYILKQIIHNWGDEHAIQILKSCYRAMPMDAKLLVIDPIISSQEPSFATFLDLQLLITHSGARIRIASEFQELFTKAGFQLTNIIPTRSPCSIVEGFKGREVVDQ
ncbi:MAG: methyltransferase [Trichocoleus desertorum ATA4-8-CV12]|jgi:hypothetical protein|nr:methyltransferase [Trichocoleus desertorum ATA4-8-CV12]